MALDDKTLFRVFRNGGLTRQVAQALIDRFAAGGSGAVPYVVIGGPTTIGDNALSMVLDSNDHLANVTSKPTAMIPYKAAANETFNLNSFRLPGVSSLTIQYLELCVMSADGAHGLVLFNNTPILINSDDVIHFGSDYGTYGGRGTDVVDNGDGVSLKVTAAGMYYVGTNFSGPVTKVS